MTRRHYRYAPDPAPLAVRADLGTCPDCGKLRFRSRPVARKAARQARQRGVRITRVYQCGGYWHWTSQGAAAAAKGRRKAERRARFGAG